MANAQAAAMKKKRKLFSIANGFDMPFLIILMLILVIGLVCMYSASYAYAFYWYDGDSYYFIKRQLAFAVLGVVAMLMISTIDYHVLHKFSWVLWIVSLALLVVAYIMPSSTGIHRWIRIPGIGQFQPSEVAKFALIVLYAHLVSLNHKKMKTFTKGYLPFMAILGITCGLVFIEPHLSGTVLILCTGAVLMIVGGIQAWLVAAGVGGVGAVGFLFVKLAEKGIIKYGSARIAMWHDPWLDYSGDGYQLAQSLITIGSGGLLGVGLGRSRQKFLYLPEQYNDFIFSVVCEELGLIGACVIMLIFALLILRGFWIALHARDRFGALLVVGIMTHLALQTFLNIAVVSGFVPTTGISLPFFSYGGTALCLQLVEMGIVLSVSRQIPAPKAG